MVVCVDRLLCVVLVVVELNLDLVAVDAAGSIDLIDRNLLRVLAGKTVDCRAAGHRADAADFPDRAVLTGFALSLCLALTGCLGLTRRLGLAALLLTAGCKSEDHGSC